MATARVELCEFCRRALEAGACCSAQRFKRRAAPLLEHGAGCATCLWSNNYGELCPVGAAIFAATIAPLFRQGVAS